MSGICHFGDCRDVMRRMIDRGERVQMCVTSPPYFGLRDYGVEGQLGLEESLQEYLDNMVDVFALVWELLAEDGTCWVNIGDSYAGSWGAQGRQGTGGDMANRSVVSARQIESHPKRIKNTGSIRDAGMKPKDLMGVPWRLAFALQDFGWYLRQDIIWHKPNPMPESIGDRCTKSHEYMFLLSKSERYYFDQDAIKEEASSPEGPGNMTNSKYVTAAEHDLSHRTKGGIAKIGPRDTRNKRSVWSVSTTPYRGAHFAVFPPKLIEPCILAGSRPGDTVLDPFFGSGTTGYVCNNLGRKWIGAELNPEYEELQKERTSQFGLEL